MKSIGSGVKIGKAATKWRESASLIILAKDNTKLRWNADYKVLLFSRPEKASFMPTSSVFPGGVHESADESLSWVNHFKNFGIQQDELNKLILPKRLDVSPEPTIFQKQGDKRLHKDISLRITAIRETFEEMGILICFDRKSLLHPIPKKCWKTFFYENFDRKHWQHLVHNNPEEFLNLCRQLDVVPDLWNINEWSVWRTPATKPKRFETVFYLVSLPSTPNVILEEKEVVDYKWITPKEALILNSKGDISLPTPQLYELTRLLNFGDLAELQTFAAQRANNGSILMLPVQRKCSNGMVSLLPGDSHYPCDPDLATEFKDMGVAMLEYRAIAEKIHRIEFSEVPIGNIYLNFDPIDGHKKLRTFNPHTN